ncbi:hypothetical protein PPACK8108_LOCUS12194, partial [Phakopsora pachyrhizi]
FIYFIIILFYFILFYFILFYFILYMLTFSFICCDPITIVLNCVVPFCLMLSLY